MSYQLTVMLGRTISTFPGCRSDYVFDVSDAEISMQCLVVDKPWGSGDQSQSFDWKACNILVLDGLLLPLSSMP
jgi:hypothetical protein